MDKSNNNNPTNNSEPKGNRKVLWIAFTAFSLGFGIWGLFAALGPFLIKWYNFSPTQALFLSAMPPLFATIISIPLGIASDKFGGRKVFTILLLAILIPLLIAPSVDSYYGFLFLGILFGLGGASFVVGNAHVSVWYPQSKQGTALGIFALGNIGIAIGMIGVPLLITNYLGGPAEYTPMPAKFMLGSFAGWRLLFFIFAIPTLIMTILYWTMTSEPPVRSKKTLSTKEIIGVYKSGRLVWIIAFLYFVTFGTLTFFSAFTPVYLSSRWGIDAKDASMIYCSALIIGVGAMRPVGGWLSDRINPIKLLIYLLGAALIITLVLIPEISFPIQIVAMFCLALLAGASAATVVKLIPTYFPKVVGTVSGLAKAAGAFCGFSMSSLMALSKNTSGSYTYGFIVWTALNILAFYFVLKPAIWEKTESRKKEESKKESLPKFENTPIFTR